MSSGQSNVSRAIRFLILHISSLQEISPGGVETNFAARVAGQETANALYSILKVIDKHTDY